MRYREKLPPGCPPSEASEIQEPRAVFRLVRSAPPTDADFRSQRAERGPAHVFEGVSECVARGVSVFADRRDAESLLASKRMKGRLLCRVFLDAGAGRIQRTKKGSHHTWWPLAAFDILSASTVEAP